MFQRRIVFTTLFVMALFAFLVAPAAAQERDPGQLVVGGAYTLAAGQQLNGDLGVIGGVATIEEDATVNGDIMVAGGSLTVAGRINGSIAVFGGSIYLEPTAYVTGDLVSFGGSMQRSPDAVVRGEIQEPGGFNIPFAPGSWFLPDRESVMPGGDGLFQPSPGHWLLAGLWRAIRIGIMALALAALALVVALLWPKGIQCLGQTTLQQPVPVLVVGLLSWAVGLGLFVVLALTICLLPVALALGLVLLAAALLSWVMVGWLVGRSLLAALKLRSATVVVEAAIGALLLTLVYLLVGIIPCTEFIFGVLIASFGLGALVLTRFGARPYPYVPVVGESGLPAVVAGEPGDEMTV